METPGQLKEVLLLCGFFLHLLLSADTEVGMIGQNEEQRPLIF